MYNKTAKLSTTFTTTYTSFNINMQLYYYSFCLHPTSKILQNSIDRCIFIIPKYYHTHISPFLAKLHWLSLRHRILFTTLLLYFKAIRHYSPDYLAFLLKLKLPTSTASRSINTFLLQLPPIGFMMFINITCIQLTLAPGQYIV